MPADHFRAHIEGDGKLREVMFAYAYAGSIADRFDHGEVLSAHRGASWIRDRDRPVVPPAGTVVEISVSDST
jgi:hypothetical protein